MLDRATIELHLVHNCFRVSNDTIGIFTVETIEFLPRSEFSKLIPIKYDIFFSFYNWYIKNTEIDVLELPYKDIQ